jgi:hypothetical protein
MAAAARGRHADAHAQRYERESNVSTNEYVYASFSSPIRVIWWCWGLPGIPAEMERAMAPLLQPADCKPDHGI